MSFDVEALRGEFPALAQRVHGKPLVYLDNAATAQKPVAVLDALRSAYVDDCANIHRAVHTLSQRATARYDTARRSVRRFLNARSDREIIFVRGTTEALNLVANSYGSTALQAGDEVLVTGLEHHSNIVPWQMACARTGARLVVAEVNDRGEVTEESFAAKLGPRTRIASFAHVSNALGTVLPVRRFVELARTAGATTVVDGAQGVVHAQVDVQALGCDFYAFSGHKLYGPTGIGVLYGREALLEAMPPYQGGGDMIDHVAFEGTTYNELPYKFEAGTPHIAGILGLGAAIEWLLAKDLPAMRAHEDDVLAYARAALADLPFVKLVGRAAEVAGAVSFLVEGAHPSDVGTLLDLEGVAVRTGHHCTQPLMGRLGIPGTARASFAAYSTRAEVDALVRGLHRVRELVA